MRLVGYVLLLLYRLRGMVNLADLDMAGKSRYRRRELNISVQLCVNERHGKALTLQTCRLYIVM